jgi:Transposase, Mutator family
MKSVRSRTSPRLRVRKAEVPIQGARVVLDVCLGQRERTEDWLDLGPGSGARGLRSPLLVVSDGAPGPIRATTELWPDADRGRCAVHRLRNILAKLPERPGLHARVRAAYWAALDGATNPSEAEHGLRVLVGKLGAEFNPSAGHASPTICRRSPSTSLIPSGSASVCGRPTCWNGLSRKSGGAPR